MSKSQMAAGLMRQIAGGSVDVHSAGTTPGTSRNALSVQSLDEVGIDVSAEATKLLEPQIVREVDAVVTHGREAHVDPVPGTQFENWDTGEPPNAASTASTACASSAMTLRPVSLSSTLA
jgi:arsenate-mycothiol transferase